MVGEVAMHINECIRNGEQFVRMYRLQSQLTGDVPDIIIPGRKYVREGQLLKSCRKKGKVGLNLKLKGERLCFCCILFGFCFLFYLCMVVLCCFSFFSFLARLDILKKEPSSHLFFLLLHSFISLHTCEILQQPKP